MLERFREILLSEANAIQNIPVSPSFEKAVALILACEGKIFTTGIGKAGYVAHKAASTFSTTGTPSVFLHPGDAPHGDVGVVAKGDVLIAFSNSGKTREIIETVHFCRNLELQAVITISATNDSPLAEQSDVVLEIGKIVEPCPLGLTPSASTTAMVAVADALALVVMEEKGFVHRDFAMRHHGGYLGKKSREESS